MASPHHDREKYITSHFTQLINGSVIPVERICWSEEKMKGLYLFTLIFIFSGEEVSMYHVTPCIERACTADYSPVCGMQKVGNCYDVNTFSNQCQMEIANDCGRGNWIPCQDNVCKN